MKLKAIFISYLAAAGMTGQSISFLCTFVFHIWFWGEEKTLAFLAFPFKF